MSKYFVLFLLCACVTRPQVEAELWMNDGIPAVLCTKYPEIMQYGVYRVVKCTNTTVNGCQHGEPDFEELMPYCSTRIKTMLSADQAKVAEWLAQLSKPHK